MGRFRIRRNNNNKEEKQLLEAQLDRSLIEEINLLCKWSGNEKDSVVAELLRYSLSQESEFQKYRQSLQPGAEAELANILDSESQRRDSSE
jgi:hypothetical protein